MTAPILLVAVLTTFLVAAAFFDLTSFTIPNFLTAGMLVLFIALMLAMALDGHPMTWHTIGQHSLAGALGLTVGMVFFALNWVGGGDAKLFAAVALWLGWDALYQYTIIATLLGGSLTLGLLVARRFPLPALLAEQPWLVRLADPQSGVPYGVALAMAALVVLPDTEIFKLAAIS